MYDICHQRNNHSLNCPYSGPGKVLTDPEAQTILTHRCTDFYTDSDVPVCCTAQQVIIMEKSIQMAEGIFGRCQTCLKNLLKSICGLACDADQDRYITVAETNFSAIYQKEYVNSIDFRIDYNYTYQVYEGCKDVIHPSSGRQAIELACGTDAVRCNPNVLYHFLGDPVLNPLVPFKINYINTEDENTRFTSKTRPCAEAYNGSYACSCIDCAESCPASDPPEADDEGYRIFDLNGSTFIVAVTIGSFGVIMLIFSSTVGRNFTLSNLPKFCGGFDHSERWLTQFFTWWGKSKSI